MNQYQIIHGDCLEKLRTLPDASVDSIVTDPPAGIGFMGREWDSDKGGMREWVSWLSGVATEMLRVLKPGGHALVWAIPRTSHWTATALEEAGFEVRDRVSHIFGSGFPKSLNISKAIDRAAGATRPVVGSRMLGGNAALTTAEKGGTYAAATDAIGVAAKAVDITAAATPEADADSGGASRYFNTFAPDVSPGFLYCPKASRKERELGCDALPVRTGGEATDREDGSAGLQSPRAGAGRGGGRRNVHPTVKPIQLMRWLCRLITPPGGTVLDPFMGSGSTGVAALQESFRFIGIDADATSIEIATARISHAARATEILPGVPSESP